MNKNLEELKELAENEKDFKSLRLQDFVIYYLIPVLEDFKKRLEAIKKDKGDLLEYHEINETGGVINIKIIFNDPKLKKKGD